jgi:hypothetical protein
MCVARRAPTLRRVESDTVENRVAILIYDSAFEIG